MSRHEIERRAYGVAYSEQADFKDTYGGVAGHVSWSPIAGSPRHAQ